SALPGVIRVISKDVASGSVTPKERTIPAMAGTNPYVASGTLVPVVALISYTIVHPVGGRLRCERSALSTIWISVTMPQPVVIDLACWIKKPDGRLYSKRLPTAGEGPLFRTVT